MEETNEKQQMPKNESITVKTTPDKMMTYVTFHAPENGGRSMTKKEIEDYLNIERIHKGRDTDLLDKLILEKTYETTYTIAKGKVSVDGKNGSVIYNFQTEKKLQPKEREDGSVDFFDLNLIENVQAGDVLAEIIQPTDGEEGYNVFGETLFPKKGKPVFPKRGRNVAISEDGFKVVATKSGQVSIIEEKIVVSEVYEVPFDVNTGTGNVNFVGSIVIKGNVSSGFKVYSAGNIDVYGVVEGAIIEAKGNITLHRGVLGGGTAQIKAGGDIAAKYIENSKVSSGGNIVSEAILHSIVNSSGNINVGGKKGLIVGGTITAGRSIKAKVVGANLGTHTELKVGIDPNLIEGYRRDNEEIERLLDEKRKANQIIELLQAKARKGLLDDEKLELLSKMNKTNQCIDIRIDELNQEKELLKQKIDEIENGDITIEQKIYPNVDIYVSSAYVKTREEMGRCTMKKSDGEVKIIH